jgi:hypothetical protein
MTYLGASTLADDSEPDSKARATRIGTICYGDIDLFLLRNSDNLERDILVAEIDF